MKGKAFNLTLIPIVILGSLELILMGLSLWFVMPVGGLVWLGGAVLVATVLAVTDHSPVAAEIVKGAFLGLIVLVILTILGLALGYANSQ